MVQPTQPTQPATQVQTQTTPPVTQQPVQQPVQQPLVEKKKSRWWIWLILVVVFLGIADNYLYILLSIFLNNEWKILQKSFEEWNDCYF